MCYVGRNHENVSHTMILKTKSNMLKNKSFSEKYKAIFQMENTLCRHLVEERYTFETKV